MRIFIILLALFLMATLAFAKKKETEPKDRGNQPISESLAKEMAKRGMTKESPILMRIFKQENVLEVWKMDASGHFALLKTYPICAWSGGIGPKFKEGDRQSPEGFYDVPHELLHPESRNYLAFNIGFPNDFDKANGRTGSFVMVHGGCGTVGCFAMTHERIKDIYALARDALEGGQPTFQLQIFPFRMTESRLNIRKKSKHYEYWRDIKQGYDYFERTKLEPVVGVCHKRYTFNAESCSK